MARPDSDPFKPLSAKPSSPEERKRRDEKAGASLGGKRAAKTHGAPKLRGFLFGKKTKKRGS